MAGAAEKPNVENVRLRKAMRDMVAMASLPALWIGQGPDGIARSLASALLATLAADLVYVRIGQPGAPADAEALRSRDGLAHDADAIKTSINALLDVAGDGSGLMFESPGTSRKLQATVTRFGFHDRSGVLLTASHRAEYPSESDRALLGVAANQTAIVLQRLHAERQSEESRVNLDAALHAADLGHWRLNLVDGAMRGNARYDQIFGFDDPTCRRDYASFLARVAPEHREKVDVARQMAIEQCGAWEVECRLAGDPPARWAWIKGRVVADANGEPDILTGIVADVTGRKQIERELLYTRTRLQAALTAGAILTWSWDIPANRLWADDSLARLFGLDPTAASGGDLEPYLAAIHAEDRARVKASLQLALDGDGDYAADYRIVQAEGPVRWVAARGQIERDGAGRPIRMAGVLVDITHRKALEHELTHRITQLAAVDQRKDEFLATLAHELRNPLAPIRNALQILKMPRVDGATTARVREVMERQVSHLVRLVDDLLDVSRVMRGKIDLRLDTVELSTVVARAVETAQPLIDAHGHSLRIDLPAEPLLLDADSVRLSQVLGNLLNNAAKYTDDGGTIHVMAEKVGREARLRVRDNGIGIPADMLDRVFHLFVQVEQSSSKSHGGLGIGLTLVRNLIEMHGGSIEVRSEGPGRGTEFEVRLPLSLQAMQDAPPSAASVPAQNLRVLVVGDSAEAAEGLALLLRLKGCEVRLANSGDVALTAGREFQPRLVLLDLDMPGMDGHEVGRRVRSDPALQSCFLVALTGWGQPADQIRTAESSFDLHLVKPVDADVLHRVLSALERT